ncbi:hypothetical protein GcM3_199052 [Golovinomyces cichoracearum]|uniref:Uncharacterized protein n=1 Tax=Golovinomyces cichoracearum TaxID=62708 RepID=A0A420HEV0_9PEZI|nr:hypothetical protein GcM3_199052 [Golovinomyces cichoracearum]
MGFHIDQTLFFVTDLSSENPVIMQFFSPQCRNHCLPPNLPLSLASAPNAPQISSNKIENTPKTVRFEKYFPHSEESILTPAPQECRPKLEIDSTKSNANVSGGKQHQSGQESLRVMKDIKYSKAVNFFKFCKYPKFEIHRVT